MAKQNQPDRYALADVFSIAAPAPTFPGLPDRISVNDAYWLGFHDAKHGTPNRISKIAKHNRTGAKYLAGFYAGHRSVANGCLCPPCCEAYAAGNYAAAAAV